MRTIATVVALALSWVWVEPAGAATAFRPAFTLAGPSEADLRNATPAALKAGYGAAAFSCLVPASGVPEACELFKELPAGLGVAEAARPLLRKYRFAPAMLGDTVIAERWPIVIAFKPKGLVGLKSAPDRDRSIRLAASSGSSLTEDPGLALATCVLAATGGLDDCKLVGRKSDDPEVIAAAQKAEATDRAEPPRLDGRPIPTLVIRHYEWGLTPDTAPDWRNKLTSDQLRGVWPARAGDLAGGSAVLECTVSLEGALFDCAARTEAPAGSGFGDAAVALAPQLLMKPAMKDGKPVVAVVRIPITFGGGPNARGPGPAGGDPMAGQALLNALVWTEAPAYADAVAAFPEKARDSSVPGHAVLSCTVKGDGSLSACAVIQEQPAKMGFGKAALDLAKRFRAPLKLADGRSTKGMGVHLPVTFPIEMLGGNPRIGKPRWSSLPTAAETLANLPKVDEVMTARVMLDCLVAPGGKLDDCKVESETPPGHDFGPYALRLAAHFGIISWTEDGLPTVGGRVHVPIVYNLGPAEPPKTAAAP